VKIQIEIRDSDAELIALFLAANIDAQACSHGPLTMELLAAMLLEDVALVVRRPGSWEGANMRVVLQGHGYRA
jgi:hypothetical protein